MPSSSWKASSSSEPRARGFRALLGALYLIDRQWDQANAAYRQELEVDAQSVDARLGLASVAVSRSATMRRSRACRRS